jgi:hypothetical protein
MTTKNLWGDLPLPGKDFRSPKQILTEQANLLTSATKGKLRGVVQMSRSGDSLTLDLSIIAPFLDNYQIGIVAAHHKTFMYPLTMKDLVTPGAWSECNNEQEFETKLEEIFRSKAVGMTIYALLTQSDD